MVDSILDAISVVAFVIKHPILTIFIALGFLGFLSYVGAL
jgi:hypothetical protein